MALFYAKEEPHFRLILGKNQDNPCHHLHVRYYHVITPIESSFAEQLP